MSFTRRDAFDVYFGGIVAIQYHPANIERNSKPQLSIDDCANIAIGMVHLREAVFSELDIFKED